MCIRDSTVTGDVLTIRNRDTWKQVSLPVTELPGALKAYFKREKGFLELGTLVVRD